MRVWIEEHGGAIITGAFVIVLIVAVTAWGKTRCRSDDVYRINGQIRSIGYGSSRFWGLTSNCGRIP